MGCDIHTRAEVLVMKRKYDEATQSMGEPVAHWKMVREEVFPNSYYRPEEPIDPFGYGNRPLSVEPYQGRNYELFSILADVRNDRQTSNIFDPSMRYEMRDSLLPLDNPRGVPEDASKGWRKYVESWGDDLHSTTYFTLTELIQAVKDGAFEQRFTNRGYVPADQFRALLENGTEPTQWAGWASNGISRKEWDSMSPTEQAAFQGHVGAEWPSTAGVSEFVTKTIPALLAIAPREGTWSWEDRRDGKPDPRTPLTDRVRLVMGFDN